MHIFSAHRYKMDPRQKHDTLWDRSGADELRAATRELRQIIHQQLGWARWTCRK